nr:protein Dok-7 [Pogona vitticeps]
MTDSAVVVEGQLKWRDGKKWKNRWVVLRKPSPVADCLLMLIYKEKSERMKGLKERTSVTLEDICGLEPGLFYEGLNHTLAIICLTQVVVLGFDNKETMHAWDVRIRYSLGEVHRFHVVVAPGTKLESGPATLHFCNDILVLVKDNPPSIMGQWKLSDLRRYGAVPNGFVFEGGTRCGFWAGVFFLSCMEGEKISFLFDCIVHGISPTKGPFGLRPVLPDPNANPTCMEERVAHEALQLEKRLSLLSHTSFHGRGGEDRSLSSSSSDTSHSDASIGSRLTIWPDQSSSTSTSQESHGLAAAKCIHLGEEKAHSEGTRSTTKLPPKNLRSRQLQEIGRQSSSDSGIATGSHSSYSGSFSSYTGSLDICHGDEFGSLLSLPLNLPSDQCVCTCPPAEHQRSPGLEYQVPSSLRHTYDTPRSLLQLSAKNVQSSHTDSSLSKDQVPQGIGDHSTVSPHLELQAAWECGQEKGMQATFPLENTKDSFLKESTDHISRWPHLRLQGQGLDSRNTEVTLSGISSTPCEICNSSLGTMRAVFSSCPVCGGLKETSILSSGTLQSSPGLKGSYELMMPPTEAGSLLDSEDVDTGGDSADPPVSDRLRSEMATYVNIPTGPTSKKQLHYMELELQESSTNIRGSESTKYAQIDITATETAHKVGSQHAQFREDRLQELEQKKKSNQACSS